MKYIIKYLSFIKHFTKQRVMSDLQNIVRLNCLQGLALSIELIHCRGTGTLHDSPNADHDDAVQTTMIPS